MSFDELMYDVLECISHGRRNNDGKVELAAMNIGCGYHSYTCSIRKWWTKKVCMASYVYIIHVAS